VNLNIKVIIIRIIKVIIIRIIKVIIMIIKIIHLKEEKENNILKQHIELN